MNTEGHSSKRQRTSLSPASPPIHLVGRKEGHKVRSPERPRTPLSPVRMSAEDAPVLPPTEGSNLEAVNARDTPVSGGIDRNVGSGIETGIQDAPDTEAADHRRTDHERDDKAVAKASTADMPFICVTRKAHFSMTCLAHMC